MKLKTDNRIRVYNNFLLADKSPIKVGGIISKYYEVKDLVSLSYLLKNIKIESDRLVIFSGATNKVFCDFYDKEVAIKVTGNRIEIKEGILTVESGVKLAYLARYLTKNGYCNWNKLADIPGEIGGSIASNAGANGYTISDDLLEITGVSIKGEIISYKRENLDFTYRESPFKKNNDFIIFSAKFRLKKCNREALEKELDFYHHKRVQNQPLGIITLGSTFKNSQFFNAYELIDGCGLRGFQYNNIIINEKHCNFLEIRGKTTRKDILYVIAFIKDKVYNKYDIKLEEEIDI